MKTILKLTAIVLTFLLLVGCASQSFTEMIGQMQETTAPMTSAVPEKTPASESTEDASPSEMSSDPVAEGETFEGRADISYVMIYNPGTYDENNVDRQGNDLNKTLNTGDLSDSIDVSMSRAGELENPESEFVMYDQRSDMEILKEMEIDLSGGKADGIQPVYHKGDKHEFYVNSEYGNTRVIKEFTCVYVGTNCYIWIQNGKVSAEDAEVFGIEFDENIYSANIELFGSHRYAESGGKIHLLFYPMSEEILGFFRPLDLFATGEASPSEVEKYTINLDHAILNINSKYTSYEKYKTLVFSTMAHEFQHLINFTDFFYCVADSYPTTWLNEGMSGYAEEVLYPGVKENLECHYLEFATSDLIRHGQSIYSFENNYNDIGVYGSVALFTQYVAKLAGDDVYNKLHSYYRDSYSMSVDDAEALYNAVPVSIRKHIESSVEYPSELRFDTPEQEWLSKLILQFYLSMLKYDEGEPNAYSLVDAQCLLYDEINPADIQGGGRVILATMDGTFQIPDDADLGLIYIGLDENFEPVTGLIYR